MWSFYRCGPRGMWIWMGQQVINLCDPSSWLVQWPLTYNKTDGSPALPHSISILAFGYHSALFYSIASLVEGIRHEKYFLHAFMGCVHFTINEITLTFKNVSPLSCKAPKQYRVLSFLPSLLKYQPVHPFLACKQSDSCTWFHLMVYNYLTGLVLYCLGC